MTRSPSQQKIWDLLPWTSTGQKEKHFEGLCDLPKAKIQRILALSPEELEAAIAKVRQR